MAVIQCMKGVDFKVVLVLVDSEPVAVGGVDVMR